MIILSCNIFKTYKLVHTRWFEYYCLNSSIILVIDSIEVIIVKHNDINCDILIEKWKWDQSYFELYSRRQNSPFRIFFKVIIWIKKILIKNILIKLMQKFIMTYHLPSTDNRAKPATFFQRIWDLYVFYPFYKLIQKFCRNAFLQLFLTNSCLFRDNKKD